MYSLVQIGKLSQSVICVRSCDLEVCGRIMKCNQTLLFYGLTLSMAAFVSRSGFLVCCLKVELGFSDVGLIISKIKVLLSKSFSFLSALLLKDSV